MFIFVVRNFKKNKKNMATSTKAIIAKSTTLEALVQDLEEKYSDVKVITTSSSEIFKINFTCENHDRRTLYVFFDTEMCIREYNIEGILLTLGFWGDSVNIMKYICQKIGGYIDENDCDDEGFYPVNEDLFLNSENATPMDMFKNKIIKELGYQNLKKTLALFEEYSKINTEKTY